jgi:hypothetical protein
VVRGFKDKRIFGIVKDFANNNYNRLKRVYISSVGQKLFKVKVLEIDRSVLVDSQLSNPISYIFRNFFIIRGMCLFFTQNHFMYQKVGVSSNFFIKGSSLSF